MNTMTKRMLFWSPRILGILFAIFLSLFALDVFNEGYSIGEAFLALLIHLIPTYLVVISLAIAWRWEWVGSILFIALALFYLASTGGGSWVISAPLLLIGSLFLLNWGYRVQLKAQ
ncbi:DUF7670 domain-containing protein [Vacuolonema iberomarrocanum]|uniref:DUF7670 domain-containing protein n=1 Tax=Vacuolonema iberomarrocanum TaxID=3454632 RepID=UPI0019DFDAE4|nr:hypothetical protein [filamentous cyanobacterium LEGE 07170]